MELMEKERQQVEEEEAENGWKKPVNDWKNYAETRAMYPQFLRAQELIERIDREINLQE